MRNQYLTTCSIHDVLTPSDQEKADIIAMKMKAESGGTADESDSRVSGAHDQANLALGSVGAKLDALTANSVECFGDFTISVLNHEFVIPLSKACGLFKIIRLFFLLMVGLLCLRLVFKTVQEI